jgi:crotonobetainyl-CoA:carnitine CoA-transferase CaiB-like acyl-CoA transferase
MEAIVDVPDDEMGLIPMFGFVNKLSGTPQEFYRPAPKIGEHNRDIVSLIGLPEDEITALEQAGVLHTGRT